MALHLSDAIETISVAPLYAHPPRDEWRPASEPPEGRVMSEDRPQYQAANKSFGDPIPTPIELAKKLRYLSNDIMVLSAEIQYVGGFGQMANIASAMELSARNLRAWAYDIEEAQG